MILNEQTDTWGPYGYDKDIIRFSVPVKTPANFVETLSIAFVPQQLGVILIIGWEKTYVEVPITIRK
ncbi:hypothetical protein Dfri01_22080 [Dyadobacter frigoris]|nr:hypothetical protein Dfri01_22080 [Dyadobacter frigoris]